MPRTSIFTTDPVTEVTTTLNQRARAKRQAMTILSGGGSLDDVRDQMGGCQLCAISVGCGRGTVENELITFLEAGNEPSEFPVMTEQLLADLDAAATDTEFDDDMPITGGLSSIAGLLALTSALRAARERSLFGSFGYGIDDEPVGIGSGFGSLAGVFGGGSPVSSALFGDGPIGYGGSPSGLPGEVIFELVIGDEPRGPQDWPGLLGGYGASDMAMLNGFTDDPTAPMRTDEPTMTDDEWQTCVDDAAQAPMASTTVPTGAEADERESVDA